MAFPANPTDGDTFTAGGVTYTYNLATDTWVRTGGSAQDGNPVGTVIMYANITPPVDYLLCNGQNVDQTLYPELYKLIGPRTPDLRNHFVKGASSQQDIDGFRQHQDTTKRPRNSFTGVTNTAGNHSHTTSPTSTSTGSDGSGNSGIAFASNRQNPWGRYSALTTGSGGSHTHAVTINGGGDAETAPKHIMLAYMIKAK